MRKRRMDVKKKIPWRSLALAIVLFTIGSVCLVIGSLLLTGIIVTEYWDRGYSLIILGGITFLPGFYVLRLFYWSWREAKGFKFSQIPEFN